MERRGTGREGKKNTRGWQKDRRTERHEVERGHEGGTKKDMQGAGGKELLEEMRKGRRTEMGRGTQ